MYISRSAAISRTFFCALIIVVASLFGLSAMGQTAAAAPPKILKVDPPNWWVSLPDPMLLIRGENLNDAKLTIRSESVAVKKVQISQNGHWAFVWLQTKDAKAQTIQIVASSKEGVAKSAFQLSQRSKATSDPKGVNPADVIYELMPDRFASSQPALTDEMKQERVKPRGWHGGNLKGVENHLDYIQQLGATAIWLTPVYDNSPGDESYHGYGTTDFYAVDHHFGTLDDYKELSNVLHQRGMKLIFDAVPNHTGPNHPWATDSPTPDWFNGTVANHTQAQGDFAPLTDPYASPLDRRDITQGWFGNTLPDLNTANPLVSEYLIQNTIWWIESAGIDALRLDTFPYVKRTFWSDFHTRLHSIYPHLITFGETLNLDPRITSYFAGGLTHEGVDTHLDNLLDYPLAGAIRSILSDGSPMTSIRDVLRQDWLYPRPEGLVTFIGNHDNKRILATASDNPQKLKFGFGLLATIRGIPQLYTGDEIAMYGGDDPDNRKDFPGGFPGDPRNAFDSSQRTPQEQEIHDYLISLVKYRSTHPALKGGRQENLFVDNSSYLFVRTTSKSEGCTGDSSASERLVIIANNSDKDRKLTIPTNETALEGCKVLEPSFGGNEPAQIVSGEVSFHLAPGSVTIYRAR